MKEFNTQVNKYFYTIKFTTDDRKAYEQIQSLCRLLIDGKDGEAIPVDWLMQKADEYANTNITYDGEPYQFTAQEIALAIALLVRDWRIENETKTD